MNTLPKVIKTEILSFLELKDILNMRNVSKQWKSAADAERLYDEDVFFYKTEHEKLVIEIFEQKKLIKEHNPILHFFSNILDRVDHPCLENINNCFVKTFIFLKKPLKISRQIRILENDLDYNKTLYVKWKRESPATEKVMDLFGGKSNYYKLPLLDMREKDLEHGYIFSVKPEEMNAPIMRGKNRKGNFFCIRFRNLASKEIFCITYYPLNCFWIYTPSQFFKESDSLANECGKTNLFWELVMYCGDTTPYYESLALTLKNGRNNVEVIE